MRQRPSSFALPALFAFPVVSSVAFAQRATTDAVPCDGTTVASISITPRDPSFLAIPRPLRELARAIGVLHTTSTRETISHFLLLEDGQPCTERQRAESERILRLQPFLADAAVRTVPDLPGRTRVDVETIDEIPTVFDVRVRNRAPSSVRFGNGNVGGRGLYVAASVERGLAYRNGAGVHLAAYQVLGHPYTFAAVADRAPLGGQLTVALGHAFLTDLQRTAWHAGFSNADRYLSFATPDGDAISLGVRRRFWDAGGVRRLGRGRYVAFAGGLITHEDVNSDGQFVVIADSGLAAATAPHLATLPTFVYRNVRLNAVAGLRALSFMPVRGFDALSAVQDVAVGVQAGALAGHTVPRLGGSEDDLIISGDLYAGHGSATSFVAFRAAGEARDDHRSGRWDSMIGSGRAAWYAKPATAHVVISSLEFAGERRERIPFQLTLGDRQGGVRGYSGSRDAGAARAVARVEERWSIGGVTSHDALGLATFVDAGRVWAGDAPFGVTSKTKVGVGVGLLAALPPQSQRLWRMDIAVPVSPDGHARAEIRLTGVWTRAFWREPDDVARGRSGAAASTIFSWP